MMKPNQVSLINYKVFNQGLWLLNHPQQKLVKTTNILPIAFLLLPSVAQAQSVVNDYSEPSRNLSNQTMDLLSPRLGEDPSDENTWGFINSPGIMVNPIMAVGLMPVDLFGRETPVIESNGMTGGLPKLWVSAGDINDYLELEANDSQLTAWIAELDPTMNYSFRVESGVYRSLITGAKLNQFNLWAKPDQVNSDTESIQPGDQSPEVVSAEKHTFFPELLLATEPKISSGNQEGTVRQFSVNNLVGSPEDFSLVDTHASLMDSETIASKELKDRISNGQNSSVSEPYKTLIAPQTPYSYNDNYQDSTVQPSTHPLPWNPPKSWELVKPVNRNQTDRNHSDDLIKQNQTDPATTTSSPLLIADFPLNPEDALISESTMEMDGDDSQAIVTETSESSTILNNPFSWSGLPQGITSDPPQPRLQTRENSSLSEDSSPSPKIVNYGFAWSGLPQGITNDRSQPNRIDRAEAQLPTGDRAEAQLPTGDRPTEIANSQSWHNSVMVETAPDATPNESFHASFEPSATTITPWNGLSTHELADRPQTDSQYDPENYPENYPENDPENDPENSVKNSHSWQSSAIPARESDRSSTQDLAELNAELNPEIEPDSFSNDRLAIGWGDQIDLDSLDLEPLDDSVNTAEIDSVINSVGENSQFPPSQVALVAPPLSPVSLPVTDRITRPSNSPTGSTLHLEFPRQNQSVKDLLSINSDYLNDPVNDLNHQRAWSQVYSSLINHDLQESLAAIAQETNSRPGVVYVLPYGNSIEILFLSPGQPIMRRIVYDTNGAILNATVKEFIADLTNPRTLGSDDYLNASQQLYQWLIAPIEEELEAKGIDTLMFAFDPTLRSLPIAALHDGEQFLVEKYRLSLIPSLNLTDLSYRNLNNSAVLAMGASQFADPTIQPLDQVSLELSAIGQNRPGQVFINEAFTPENLKLQDHQGSYGIVHLATHVEFNPEQEQNSYIQFWNSRLTLGQMQEIGWQNQSLELLVMSGCETAFGSQNVELGFAGLAVQNGVKSVLASLWQVDDQGTLGLMSEFYRHLNSQDQTIKAEALRQAQLALLQGKIRMQNSQLTWVDDPQIHPHNLAGDSGLNEQLEPISVHSPQNNLAHPYFWAAFTLVGNPW